MTIGSLFSGIGGLTLGLKQAGFGEVRWQVERDPFARSVLAKHHRNAKRYDDVTTLDTKTLAPVDLVCGGFPCQDLSSANTSARAGLAGAKSGLWYRFAEIVRDVRPRWVVVENVGNQWRQWVPAVRGDLFALGYASVCLRLRAADVGAPFLRDRCFVVANAHGNGQPASPLYAQASSLQAAAGLAWKDWGSPSPEAMGLDDGLPGNMDRLRAYGNSVVPAVGEAVGRFILAVEG